MRASLAPGKYGFDHSDDDTTLVLSFPSRVLRHTKAPRYEMRNIRVEWKFQ